MTTEDTAKIIKLCYENYDEKTMAHVLRVADYALQSCLLSQCHVGDLYITAICHDLLEDTNVSLENIKDIIGPNNIKILDALSLLTKPKDMNYIEYIKKIKESKNILAYCVKLSDMKDHLTQTETLTEKLKEKYWNAIPYLL